MLNSIVRHVNKKVDTKVKKGENMITIATIISFISIGFLISLCVKHQPTLLDIYKTTITAGFTIFWLLMLLILKSV